MAAVGRPPKPTEQKRRLGNPGRRPLPVASVTLSSVGAGPPDPPRPLGVAGLHLWERAWAAARVWLSPQTDLDLLLIVCEQMDERVALRIRVLREGDADQRRALRDIDKQVVSNLSLLGFTPTDRARLGVAEVKAADHLEAILARRKNQQ